MKPDLPYAFLRELNALYRLRLLYPGANERVRIVAERAAAACASCGTVVRLSLLGKEAVLQDRELSASSPLQALIRAIRLSGYESLRFEPATSAEDLLAWMRHLLAHTGGRFRHGGVAAGYLDLSDHPVPQDSAVFDHLALLPQLEEAFTSLGRAQPQGLIVAFEIVRAIAANLADRPELFEPIRVLKGHDNYTFTHALNVCALATAMGRALGVSGRLLDALSLAALCHDVGKQAIPSSTLNRNGPLDVEERRVMDAHPVIGARMLVRASEREGLDPLVPVVAFQHHTGLDGSGYPRMPRRGTVHPGSLVVAVADVFDAIRTVRPYRPARSAARACTVLIGDARSGKLHRQCVSTLVELSKLIGPGVRVGVSDGRVGVVLESGLDPLEPLVEFDGGEQVDLAVPGAPALVQVVDDVEPSAAR